jgi:hypothetical protein
LVRDVAGRAGVAEAVVPDFVLAVQELMTNANHDRAHPAVISPAGTAGSAR